VVHAQNKNTFFAKKWSMNKTKSSREVFYVIDFDASHKVGSKRLVLSFVQDLLSFKPALIASHARLL